MGFRGFQVELPLSEAEEMSRAASFEERARAKIVFDTILKKLKKKPGLAGSGVEWARALLTRHALGESMLSIQLEMAQAAIERADGSVPDTEAARERAAIQCEHLPV